MFWPAKIAVELNSAEEVELSVSQGVLLPSDAGQTAYRILAQIEHMFTRERIWQLEWKIFSVSLANPPYHFN